MPKIIINSSVKSSEDEELLKDIKAIIKDNIITYNYGGISVCVTIKDNMVILTRENDEMKITLKFEKNKKATSYYEIKELKLNIELTVDTKDLVIKDKMLSVKYDLYLNNEFSDSFDYKLDWRDL